MLFRSDENGDRLTEIVPELDENGNPIVDVENSKVTVSVIKEFYERYKLADWKISNATVRTPHVAEEDIPEYTGKVINLEEIISGFNKDMMELSGEISATDAGTYTAKIKLTNENSVWEDTTEEYVTVTWTIAKATVDLSDVKWDYTAPFTYERAGGKAVIRRVALELPDILKDKVKYTTNGVAGSNAGRDAGKYVTTFEFVNLGNNFNEITVPETLSASCTWNIKRKVLDVPRSEERRVGKEC